MSKQLVMKFMLQLHGTRKCLERKCWQELVLSNNAQSNRRLRSHVMLLNEMNSVAGDTLERGETCSVKQNSELQKLQRQSQDLVQEYEQDVHHHLSEVQK